MRAPTQSMPSRAWWSWIPTTSAGWSGSRSLIALMWRRISTDFIFERRAVERMDAADEVRAMDRRRRGADPCVGRTLARAEEPIRSCCRIGAVRTVADPIVLGSLTDRLRALRPGSERRWGTLSPHEMLCHLGDAMAMVLGDRPRGQPVRARHRWVVKGLALWSPIPWPHGWPTNPMHDPKVDGTQPSVFAQDLARTIAGLEAIAEAAPNTLEPVHGFFGTMSVRDWQRWAYRHADHHLRQFGL